MKYRRLKKAGEFQKLFKKGKKVYSRNLCIIYTPCKEKCTMGIALSKKHGKAVVRNRIKRLIRAAYSDTIDALDNAYSMVIMPRVGDEYSYNEFKSGLLSCYKRMEK